MNILNCNLRDLSVKIKKYQFLIFFESVNFKILKINEQKVSNFQMLNIFNQNLETKRKFFEPVLKKSIKFVLAFEKLKFVNTTHN